MKVSCFFTFMFLLCACNDMPDRDKGHAAQTPHYLKLKQAEWLLGSWQHIAEDGVSFESWHKENDSSFSGVSYFMIGKDTVSSEVISLVQRGETLSYNPTVSNQNDGKAVTFTLSFTDSTQLIFENAMHDFPQKISYTKVGNDSIYAEISGRMKGEQKVIPFPLRRIKESM